MQAITLLHRAETHHYHIFIWRELTEGEVEENSKQSKWFSKPSKLLLGGMDRQPWKDAQDWDEEDQTELFLNSFEQTGWCILSPTLAPNLFD